MAEYIDGFNLVEKNEETVKGWVADSECLARVLEAHSIDTGCQFVSWHDDRKKKEGEEYNGRFLWKHKDIPLGEEQPFKLGRHIIKQCQYGRQHKRTQRSKDCIGLYMPCSGQRSVDSPSGTQVWDATRIGR